MTTEDEIKAEYTSSLADLTFNSKPLINVLTMLAEENLPNARVIVEAIEEHLSKVSTDVKLPILYLIDCIVKNVGQTYTGLFSQNIVSTFCSVFKMVDEKTRSEMFKLRQTWNDVFPQMKLYAIDVQISTIDPAWPVTAQPSNSIHLNPKFLKNTTPPSKTKLPAVSNEATSAVAKPITADIDKETLLMQEQLIQKQKELLELQKKTLELEVLQTQVRLQEQIKSGAPPVSTNILLKPEVAKQLIPEAITKSRPTGLANSLMNQRLQNNVITQPRINPVSPALATAKPIRDPRLLRQQQQQQKLQQQQQKLATAAAAAQAVTSVPAQKTTVLENNKNVTNKLGVRDIAKDPRLSNKSDKKSKSSPKSRDSPTTTNAFDLGHKNDKSSPRHSTNKPDVEKSSETSPKLGSSSSNSSLASTSSSSLHSPSKSKSRSPNKHRKRDKGEGSSKHSSLGEISSKREKISPVIDGNNSVFGKNSTEGDVFASFKSVKHSKNRNYMRRNMRESPVPVQDEDLRALPVLDKSPRAPPLEAPPPPEVPPAVTEPDVPTPSKPMDVDLRQLPQIPPVLSKKRTSTEASDQASKKSRSFDVLFGSEDTDLRQLPVAEPERIIPVLPERPPTPPPPIISAEEPVIEKPVIIEKPLPQSPKKAELDAIRAKLANATNRDKIMAKSFHKNKLQQDQMGDQDLRVTMPPKVDSPLGLKRKITISPEEEKFIKSGQMTREQEKQIMNKIFMQIEKEKLREAKIKDHKENFGDISLQAISDDELDSDPEENIIPPVRQPVLEPNSRVGATTQIPPPPMPFNDKDERLNLHHMPPIPMIPQTMENMPPVQPPQFYPRGEPRRPPFRAVNPIWRGRGRNMPPQGPPPPRQPIRPWMHQQPPRWRNPGPFVPPSSGPEFSPVEDDSSRSPGQDFGPQELTVMQEEIKTLNIDGIPRDIRVYNETAVIFLNWDDPREISFQAGARRIIFNNKESYILTLGDDYKECVVNGFPFRVKLGVPSRELFINDLGFECIFGGAPIHVSVNGMNVTVVLEGPPPQVKIGDLKRTDLVIGKINLIINAKLIVPVFLDGKLQKFVVEGEPCTLKFVDSLKRVLINDVAFNVEFGGLPKPFTIHGKKHFIRFSVLPKGVRPGSVRIRDMEGESGASPIRQEEEDNRDVIMGPLESEPLRPDLSRIRQPSGLESPDNRSSSPTIFSNILQPGLNNFDVISNVFSQSLAPAPTDEGYQVELSGKTPQSEPKEGTTAQQMPLLNTVNINELFQKLVASGFVKTQDSPRNDSQEMISSVPPVSGVGPMQPVVQPVSNGKGRRHQPKKNQDVGPIPPNKPPPKRPLIEILRPVTFARPETLKIRQAPLYVALYTGMQCSSCGMRFTPESSMLYSQHLDWHFRQNRKGKKNARVANSRRWYYSLSDWKNYEEIEDLEEREKNYFDQQQQQAEVAEEGDEELEIPSVLADPGSTDEKCYVCRDAFEQFFHEEKEEWHLRNAIKMDNKTYHPVCYDDYQKSILDITLDDSKIEDDTLQPQNKLIPGLEIILDDDEDDDDMAPGTPNEIVSLAGSDDLKMPVDSPDSKEDVPEDDGDDDDVILNEVAPIKIVVDDDEDDDQPMNEDADGGQRVPVKKEKRLTTTDDDGFVDVDDFVDVGVVSFNNIGQVKIKSEPVDKDESITEILDASITSEPPTEPQTPEGETPRPVTSQPELGPTHAQLITSIDGNIELVSNSHPMPPTTVSGGSKIKINISKPLPVITPKENSETSDNSELDIRSSEIPMEEPEIVRYKPALQNVPLKKLAPVKKGNELTGLCSIM